MVVAILEAVVSKLVVVLVVVGGGDVAEDWVVEWSGTKMVWVPAMVLSWEEC